MKLVSIIIVNHNRRDFLVNCLNSLKNQTYPTIEIILIDDCSTDDSVNVIKKEYPEVNLIINDREKLLCVSQNIGINESRGDYILFLENDVILGKNYIEELIKFLDFDEKIAMAVGKILKTDRQTIDSTGLFLGESRKPIEKGFNQIDKGQFEKPGNVFGVGQIAGLFRRSSLEDLKLDKEYIDETYGIFYEDLDLSWRANRFGWRAYYNPKAVAYHVRGATAKSQNPPLKFLRKYYFPQLSEELQFHFIKNRYMTIIKNDTIKDFILCLPNIFFYDFKLWGYVLLFRPSLVLRLPQILKYLKIALVKRKAIKVKLERYKRI